MKTARLRRSTLAILIFSALGGSPLLAQPAQAATPPAQPPSASGTPQTTRTVRTGDTLGKIAREIMPAGATLQQAMLGLFQANPGAFSNDSMNRLRAGALLVLPSSRDLIAIPAAEAHAEVRAKTGGRSAGPAPQAATPSAPAAKKTAAAPPALAKSTAEAAPTAKPESTSATPAASAPAAPPPVPTAAALTTASRHVAIDPPLPRQPGLSAQQIEVVEYFWYGCPHCYEMEPLIRAWAGRQGADVALRRLPATLGMLSEPGTRLFFTLEALGQAERLHEAVFEAAHSEGRLKVMSSDEEKHADWAARHGVDKTAFIAAWSSPGVSARMKQATEWSKAFRGRKLGVPLFVVEGRWATNASLTGEDEKAVLPEVDALVEKVRAERRKN